MNANEIATIVTTIITAINTLAIAYFAWQKNKPEVKKLDAEGDSEYAEAANLNLEGAKVSAQMLLDRVNELKGELKDEKDARELSEKAHKEDIAALKQTHEDAMVALEKARKEDIEYFRRRIKDLERESRDYRSWAAKLAKQVVEAGKIPAPFIPTIGDSDTGMTAIRPELESQEITGPQRPSSKKK